MSQHISPVDCAPVSPFVALSSQLSSINAQLQDIPSFTQQSKASSIAAAPLLAAQQVRQLPAPVLLGSSHSQRPSVRPEEGVSGHVGSFVSQFHGGVAVDSPHAAMAEQFRRMEISKHQHNQQQQRAAAQHADELERIYRQHAPQHLTPTHTAQPTSHWAAEFNTTQPHALVPVSAQHQHHHQQQLHRLHQQIVQQPPQWAAEFAAIKQQQHHSQHHPHHMAAQHPMMQSAWSNVPSSSFSAPFPMHRSAFQHMPSASLLPHHMTHASLATAQLSQPVAHPQPHALNDATNVHSVSERDMVNSFPASSSAASQSHEQQQSPSQATGDGLGGGLNADMIDALLRSDDPKWRQSKFLQFISKIKSGQIEFRDNQAIDTSNAAQADSSSAENQQQRTSGDQWADEYSSEDHLTSSFPSAWSEDFEQREGMRGLSTSDDLARMAAGWSSELNAEAEDEKVWEDEYRRVVQAAAGEREGEGALDEDGVDVDEKEWARHFQQGDEYSEINWREALERAKAGSSGATVELESAADPQYAFTSPLQSSHTDANAAFEEGVRLLERGELRAAISSFETAVRLDPDHSEAWCQLGAAQAENEEESNAIAALLRSVAIDPYNLKALMMLGVSYTNDLEESRALQYLKTWLENNPDYQTSNLSSVPLASPSLHSGAALHDQVARLFHSAVSQHPSDPDLHTVLGVLYHLSSDFDRAVDSFKAAIKQRPNDATLWNKLGATLANSSRSQDALHAYQRALQLRPRYVRAMANLAISFANMGQHDEAVAVYLRVLHANSEAQHVWSYLRISLSHLGKDNLVKLTDSKNVDLFRPYYEF